LPLFTHTLFVLDSELFANFLHRSAGVFAVSSYQLERRVIHEDHPKKNGSSDPVMHRCRSDQDTKDHPHFIGCNMPFMALDFLPTVDASRSLKRTFRNGLAIQYGCRWRRIFPRLLSNFFNGLPTKLFEATRIPPRIKIAGNSFPRRKIYGKHLPLAPGFLFVKNGVEDFTNRVFDFTHTRQAKVLWENLLSFDPFFIRKIRGVFLGLFRLAHGGTLAHVGS